MFAGGDQLLFHWDRLENFLITLDRPVGNKVTSTKYHKMQCLSFLCRPTFWNIDWKNVLFRYLVNSMQNQAWSTY